MKTKGGIFMAGVITGAGIALVSVLIGASIMMTIRNKS